MPRLSPFLLAITLAACAPGVNLAGLLDPAEAERRAAVEVVVKSYFPAVLQDIEAGGGPTLEAAFEAGEVPPGDRPARALQLSGDLGLYAANPGALSAAIALYGN